MAENNRFIVQVFVGALSQHYEALSVEASKTTTSEEILSCIVERLSLPNVVKYELAEVIGEKCKERRLGPQECPVALMLLWPRKSFDSHKTLLSGESSATNEDQHRFYLREKLSNAHWAADSFTMDPQLIRDYLFVYEPKYRDYPDLCQLPDLIEQTLLEAIILI